MNEEVINAQDAAAPVTEPLPSNGLPLFYQQIEVFDTARHAGLSCPKQGDFRFAANATVIPVLISELPLLMRHYPLVFLPAPEGGAPTLAALVGLGTGRNLFVNEEGEWQADTYIPAYVRRYPFHALRVDTQADPLLAIDPSGTGLAGEVKLVDAEGKPSSYVEEMLTFSREYLVAAQRTEAICIALHEAGILDFGDLTLQEESGEAHQINGFLAVSEERLRTLPADSLVKLQAADALGMAYAQLLSMANLVHLPRLAPEAPMQKTSRTQKKIR